jgi:hypothetical protein
MTFTPAQAPFLRTSRRFPADNIDRLTLEIDKTYIDVANAVNVRSIGIFPTNIQMATGNSWFVNTNYRQQTLRQVYTFTATTSINHGIMNISPQQFVNCFGNYTDGTNAYGLFWATSVAIAGQITFYVTTTQIIFNVSGTAPALLSGSIVLEWLSQP